MEEQTPVIDDEDFTILGEVRSILFSATWIVFNTEAILQNEVRLSRRRRILLTIFLASLLSFLIAMVGLVFTNSLVSDTPLMTTVSLIVAVIFFSVILVFGFLKVLISGPWTYRLLRNQDDEVSFFAYIQSIAIVLIPREIIMAIAQLGLGVMTALQTSRFDPTQDALLMSLSLLILGILGLVAVMYFYRLIGRILVILYPNALRSRRRGALFIIFLVDIAVGFVQALTLASI